MKGLKNNPDRKIIGQNIRKARKKAGLTLENVGNLVGLSTVAISQYERGERVPDIVTMFKILEALRCSIDEIATENYKAQMRIDSTKTIELGPVRAIEDSAFRRIESAYLRMDDDGRNMLVCIAEAMANRKVDRHVQ